MEFLVFLYIIIGPAVVIISIIATYYFRRNRLKEQKAVPTHGFHPTDEIFIDPTTNIKQRVWFNPHTGERRYQNMDDHLS
ncbi:MAG: hypothetical protein P0Y55_18340 [Candidatus Cohnella colombiensis]|uniref:HD family phosphohydrolase n=1 Tax=Candidatus Cohnella colombiensis TaxID=3121368 RepID=A0AA95EWY2_9BACL|nr:MAG: hypothetical protein P0Y55_18340 [Cohnella sp.]